MTRDEIEYRAVRWMLQDGNIGYRVFEEYDDMTVLINQEIFELNLNGPRPGARGSGNV